jgi:5-methylcytosine-specific restriction endonuclease McrA
VLRAVWHGDQPVSAPATEIIAITPLFFGLLPRSALTRDSVLIPVKDDIRRHLRQANAPCDEILVDVLKRVADQYVQTRPPRRLGNQKMSLGTLRASRPHAAHALMERQNNRCAVCGLVLSTDTYVAIDHVLPWRIGGDKDANLQLLCEKCNRGKRDYVSPLQSSRVHGWMYGLDGDDLMRVNEDSRYVALAVARRCMHQRCHRTPRDSVLDVFPRDTTSILTIDNLVVGCEHHAFATADHTEWREWQSVMETSEVTFGWDSRQLADDATLPRPGTRT